MTLNTENIANILAKIPDAAIALDADWNFVFLNDKAIHLSGGAEKMPAGRNIWTEWPEQVDSPFYEACHCAMGEQRSVSLKADLSFFIFNGSFEIDIYPSANGIMIFFKELIAKAGDVSAMNIQKKLEEEIRKSNERLSMIAMATNEMIWDWNLLTNEISWNDNYNNVFGYSGNENIHTVQTWVNSVHPNDRLRVEEGIFKVISEGEVYWADEYRCLRNDGTVLNISDRGFVARDANGKAYRMIGSMQNITERIKAELAVKEREEKYRNIFERASDTMVLHDMKGLILDVNFAATDFSGYSREEMKGMNITDFLFPEDIRLLPIPFERLAAGETTTARRRLKTRTGLIRVMEVNSKMLPDGNVMALLQDVTERSETDAALRNSELRFRTLTGNAPVGIFETNADGETIYANEKMSAYTGLCFDELLGLNWLEAVHPEDRNCLLNEWKKNFAEKKESTSEYRLVDRQGNTRWVSGKAVPVYDKNLQYSGYLGTISDITTEKTALLALRESEEKYRTLVEQASDAIYIADTNGHIITVNSSACKLSQYSQEELLKMSVYDFLDTKDLETNPLQFAELKEGKTVMVERRVKRRNGNYLHLETTAKMLTDGRILVFARDISDRIRAQKEILKEKKLSDSIINSLPGTFYLYDEAGNLLRWNKNFETVSGYGAHEITNIKPGRFFDDFERKLVKAKVKEVFTKGISTVEANFLTKDNKKIPYYFTGLKITFENKTCMIGVGMDISEKRKAEELLKKSYDDIRQLVSHLTQVREEERKRIGREIHDELGQQLTAIKMDVAWIDKKTPDETNPIKSNLKNIISMLDGSNQAVRRILTELSPGIVDNDGLLEAIARLNRQFTASTGIPLEFTCAESKIILPQDISNCIFRVYQESLTNIMRYAQAEKVATTLSLADNSIFLNIEDNGNGFDTAAMPTNKSFGILGMKERVQSQNGHFSLESKIGKGTKIILSVPFRPA